MYADGCCVLAGEATANGSFPPSTVLGPLLNDVYSSGETHPAWLGYMNAGRIVPAEVRTASAAWTAAAGEEPLRAAVYPAEFPRGAKSSFLARRTPGKTWRLVFDGAGVRYEIFRYDGLPDAASLSGASYLRVESSGMTNGWLCILA